MRSHIELRRFALAAAVLAVAPTVAAAQAGPTAAAVQVDVQRGRAILDRVLEAQLGSDFDLKDADVELRQFQFSVFLKTLMASETDEKDREEQFRRTLLHLEMLGRDIVAGKPIPAADAKSLNEHFPLRQASVPAEGTDRTSAWLTAQAKDQREHFQNLAEKLAAGQPLMYENLPSWFTDIPSGRQFSLGTVELSFDVPKMAKAYSSAPPLSRHVIRVLIGLGGKADDQTVPFILTALRGSKPIERYDAAFAAGQLRPVSDKLVSALTACLDDPDPRVARAAIRALLQLNAAQAAPAMLRRLQGVIEDQESMLLDCKNRFEFTEYRIRDSEDKHRYDLPTELMFALGRFRCREAAPLLWEIVRGKGENVWQSEAVDELSHGAAAFDAIVALGLDDPASTARRMLAMDLAGLKARGAAASVLGERGQLADVPAIVALMPGLEAEARRTPDAFFRTRFTMSRVSHAAERLVFCSDRADPKFAVAEQALVVALGNGVRGPFGESMVAALELFDRQHVGTTAISLAADTKVDPDLRKTALEILGRSGDVRYLDPMIALFDDAADGYHTVGLYAAEAVAKILETANRTDSKVAACVARAAEKMEWPKRAMLQTDAWGDPPWAKETDFWEFRRVLMEVDSDRGVRACSRAALDEKLSHGDRMAALECIARHARPNRELASPLRPLLDAPLGSSAGGRELYPRQGTREQQARKLREGAVVALARLLELSCEGTPVTLPGGHASVNFYPDLVERLREELDQTPPKN